MKDPGSKELYPICAQGSSWLGGQDDAEVQFWSVLTAVVVVPGPIVTDLMTYRPQRGRWTWGIFLPLCPGCSGQQKEDD